MKRANLRFGATSSPSLDRLATAQLLSGAADALVAVSLAGSLFFSLSPEASQEQVLLYLVINMAPYIVLAPLIGPAIDRLRHGPGAIAAALFAVRAVCAFALAVSLLELGLYFFALALLVAAKANGVVRQALVPGLVADHADLVAVNSHLARLSVIAGAVGGLVGAGLLAFGAPGIVAAVAGALFLGAAWATARLPGLPVPPAEIPPSVSYEELHRPTIVATSWAFTVVRAAVGFFVFGLAFALRRESEPAWMYGVTIALYGIGSFAGNVVAPVLRRRYGEDLLIAGALGTLAVVAAFAALGQSRPLVLLVAGVLGGTASVARQGFDSLVQRRAPTATHGRAFARFETRFQLAWVLGAIAATAIGIPIRISLAIVAGSLLPAAVLYLRALREARRAHADDPFDPVQVARRRLDHAREWDRRGGHRLAVTEVAGVVDLARAIGHLPDLETVERIDRLRADALSTWPLDEREVTWALARAGELIDTMDRRAGADREVAGGETSGPASSADQSGSTDDDVTDHSEERSSTVSTAFDQSSSDR
ncbi:MAG: MFS transporter [Ilumatobacteraceae bacterium]